MYVFETKKIILSLLPVFFVVLAAPAFVGAAAYNSSCFTTPIIDITKSMNGGIVGSNSYVDDNNYSTFLGAGEAQHHGGWVKVVVNYNLSCPVNLQNVSFRSEIITGGSSSDRETQEEKVTIWNNSGQRIIYERSVVAGGNLDTKTITGSFNGVTRVELSFYAGSFRGSSDRYTRVRIYEIYFLYDQVNPHSDKQCYDNDVYWYDSQGNRQEIYEDCGEDSWTNNYQCSGASWLQRQKTIRWCSNATCRQSTRYDDYQDCSASSQTCQNNSCTNQSYRYLSCYDNDVYWYDNYKGREEKYQECGESYCEGTGYNYCSGNSVYQQRTCYNRGCAGNACYGTTSYSDTRLVQTCGSGQTCQNGSCITTYECVSGSCCDNGRYKNTSSICNTETEIEYGCPWGLSSGSDVGFRTKIRSRYCSGNSNQCTGNWGNWTALSNWIVAAYCNAAQTCIYGNQYCRTINNPSPEPSYILHYSKQCYGNDIYWYDSLNAKQNKYKTCQDNNDCTIDSCSAGKCSNKLTTTCGDGTCGCGETIVSCSQDCSLIGLAITIFSKKENDPVQWAKTFGASAGQKLDFLIVVSNGRDDQMNSVTIKTDLPQEIIYKGDLKIEGNSSDGDIRTGVNLGTLTAKTVKTITFKGEITIPDNISRDEIDATATVNTSAGSSSDNIKISLMKEGQQTVIKPEGFLAGLLKINLNKPLYILLGIIIAILILMGLARIIRNFKGE